MNADAVKKTRIYACIDATKSMLEKMVEHNAECNRRQHAKDAFLDECYGAYTQQRQRTRQQRLANGGKKLLSKDEYLVSEEFKAILEQAQRQSPDLIRDAVKDTPVRLFSLVPVAKMRMMHSTVNRRGLLSVLKHLGVLPEEVANAKNSKAMDKKFTNEIASRELNKWLSPERPDKKGSHFGSRNLVLGPYCRVNPITVCFQLRPAKAVKSKAGFKSSRGKTSRLSYADLQRIKLWDMETEMDVKAFWKDGKIVLPSEESMNREVFLHDEQEAQMWEALKYDVWAVDPGENYIYYAVRLRDGKTLSLTREAFYVLSKMDERERKTKAWMNKDSGVVDYLKAIEDSGGPKTADPQKHREYLAVLVDHMNTIRDKLWHEIGRKRARQDFNVHINRQRTVSKEIAEFAKVSDKPVLVIWGTAHIRYDSLIFPSTRSLARSLARPTRSIPRSRPPPARSLQGRTRAPRCLLQRFPQGGL